MAKITLIDDSQATIDMLAGILKGANHNVNSYTDATAVEDKVAADKPDLIMLDIVMPARNGYEVLRGLRRNAATKDIPVILVSSKSEDTDIRWGKRQGAADYVTKPFTPDSILSAVQNHV